MKYLSKAIYVLLFLVMVTLPYAGHTYAEYAREANAADSARITKFGVTTTCTSNAFAVSYDSTVKSAGTDKVIAPGTSGTFCTYGATGESEVRIRITKTATITMNDYWTNGSGASGTSGSFYCPLTFTIGSTTINGLDYSSKTAFIAALKAELEKGNGDYGPQYNLSTGTNAADLNRTVTWSWPYQGATGSAISQNQTNDNALGNKATKPTIQINMSITVEQID